MVVSLNTLPSSGLRLLDYLISNELADNNKCIIIILTRTKSEYNFVVVKLNLTNIGRKLFVFVIAFDGSHKLASSDVNLVHRFIARRPHDITYE